MKKTAYMLIWLSISIVFFGGCNKVTLDYSEEIPHDFNFTLTYGTYGKEKIDTFNDRIIKDLVLDGTIEATISFTEEEMGLIYNKMKELNIMGDLDLKRDKRCETEPPSFTEWNIQMNDQTKTINYGGYCEYPEDVLDLLKLEHFIHNILTEKLEYKQLPETRGGYE